MIIQWRGFIYQKNMVLNHIAVKTLKLGYSSSFSSYKALILSMQAAGSL